MKKHGDAIVAHLTPQVPEGLRPPAARKGHWTSKFTRAALEDRTSPDGIAHDSVVEMRRWVRLKTAEAEGIIDQLERQIPFPLFIPPHEGRPATPILTRVKHRKARKSKKTGKMLPARTTGGKPIVMKLDFRYRDKLGMLHGVPGAICHEEYKGFMAEDAALKISTVEALYGIEIFIVRKP